ncbi:MAG: outer membrane protein assembly factor BamD [Hyphomicrobiaceae bacterium]
MRPLAFAFVALLAVLPLAGCASMFGGGESTATIDNPDPPDVMFANADALLNAGSYEEAAKKFEDVERFYPFSNDPSKPYARKALALAAYAYYKATDYDNAIAAGRRYTTMHAGTEDAALAHHVVAMSYFDQMQDPARDQTNTRRAMEEFRTLLRLYPTSAYSQQDANRLRICEDSIAASEMSIGRYYQKKRNFIAAINRFKTVVTEYQRTAQVEEALFRLTESYLALGIEPEAQSAAAILGHNFPNSHWYKDAYALLKGGGLSPESKPGSAIAEAWSTAVASVSGLNPFGSSTSAE